MRLHPGNTATGTTSLHILMIRTGSSLGTNKVFFGCGSNDEDGHHDDCGILWGFSPESLRLATLTSHQGHLKREERAKHFALRS